jgi:hypothetical protein
VTKDWKLSLLLPMEEEPPVVQRLFTPNQATVACLIGSPLAGCHLLARNFLKLRKKREAILTFLGGLILMGILFGLRRLLPKEASNTSVAILGLLAVKYAAMGMQGDTIAVYRANGGAIASWWTVVGIGVAWMAGVLTVVAAVLIVTHGNRL